MDEVLFIDSICSKYSIRLPIVWRHATINAGQQGAAGGRVGREEGEGCGGILLKREYNGSEASPMSSEFIVEECRTGIVGEMGEVGEAGADIFP